MSSWCIFCGASMQFEIPDAHELHASAGQQLLLCLTYAAACRSRAVCKTWLRSGKGAGVYPGLSAGMQAVAGTCESDLGGNKAQGEILSIVLSVAGVAGSVITSLAEFAEISVSGSVAPAALLAQSPGWLGPPALSRERYSNTNMVV